MARDGLRSGSPSSKRRGPGARPAIRDEATASASSTRSASSRRWASPATSSIVWDFIRYARENGIPVGPGRGSAAGSLVAYCLGSPTSTRSQYDLLFERFLNPERISMPDIDIDFCMRRRGEVIDYVGEKYGRDHVAQIITFGTLARKAVIRDVGRVLGCPTPRSTASPR